MNASFTYCAHNMGPCCYLHRIGCVGNNGLVERNYFVSAYFLFKLYTCVCYLLIHDDVLRRMPREHAITIFLLSACLLFPAVTCVVFPCIITDYHHYLVTGRKSLLTCPLLEFNWRSVVPAWETPPPPILCTTQQKKLASYLPFLRLLFAPLLPKASA